MNRRAVLGLLLGLAPLAGRAAAAERLRVTASFSILADLVRAVGGERVDVASLVGPGGDAHVYQPTPADARTLAASRLLVVNGLGFEGWMARLARASGFKGETVTASKGVRSQRMEDEHGQGHGHVPDPHAWQSLANARIYVANLRDALAGADPEGRAVYEANARAYAAALDALEAEIRAAIERIPPERRRIVTTHDAFGYFGTAYGLAFLAPEGVSTENEASAADVAKIIRQVRAERIPAVFLETVTDRRLLEQIARETGARIGGTLYSDALSAPDGPAATYLDMMRHNLRTLTAALAPAS